MPRAAVFALALLVTATAADVLRGPFNNGQHEYGKRNETRDSSFDSVNHHSVPQTSSERHKVSPEALPTSTLPSTTVKHAYTSYGSAPLGTSPPTRLPRPSGKPQLSPNGTCHGATVNIVGASLDWWYTETTYTQVDSTFLIQVNSNDSSTAWTLLPATETFNVTSAVANPSCASSTAFNPNANATMLQYSCIDTPTPVAAVTTTVEQTAYVPVNATTSNGAIPNVVTSPTPAAITVANANGSSTYAAGTPFVHFSQYDLVSKRPFHYGDGRVGCAEITQVHTMPTPGSFEYTGDVDKLNGSFAAVAGEVHPAALGFVGQLNATAGSFVAEPTVVVVVHKILAAQRMFAMVQPTASELEMPEATLPPSLSTIRETPTETGIIWSPLAVHIESSQSFLAVPTRSNPISQKAAATTKAVPVIVPFVAHLENQDVTLAMPVNPNAQQAVITALWRGETVTATAMEEDQSADRPSKGAQESAQQDNIGRVISAVVKAAQQNKAAPQAVGNAIASVIGAAHPSEEKEFQQQGSGHNAASQGFVTIGSSVVPVSASQGQNGLALVVGGQTITPGKVVTVDGTRISLAVGATEMVIGSSTIHLLPTSNPGKVANIPLITVGSKTWTANAATQFNIAGTTLTPGGTAVAFGSTIVLGPSATRVVVNGKTQALSPAITPAPHLTIDGTVYRPNAHSTYDVGSQLLTRGGQVVASGTTISLAGDGSVLVVDGLTRPVGSLGANDRNLATITAAPNLSLDGKAFVPNGGASYVISGHTLTPGGVITFSGSRGMETVSLDSALDKVIRIANGHTATSAIGLIGAAPGGAPILTIDGETYLARNYEAGRGATYVIDDQTLTPGGKITISGADGQETISLLAEGTAIVSAHAGVATTSSINGAYGVMPTNAPILTIAGQTFSAIDEATFIVDGQTLTPGGSDTVTINGHRYIISLSPHATLLQIETLGQNGKVISTMLETLFPAQQPATTITNTEPAATSTAEQRMTGSHSASPTGETGHERHNNGASASTPALGGVVGMLCFLALTLLF